LLENRPVAARRRLFTTGKKVASVACMQRPACLEFFSLGGVLSAIWKPRLVPLPWMVAAFLLVALGCWDLARGAGRVDFILIGLAGYECVLGLTEDPHRAKI
jgi:hypothetical protein